MLSLSKHGVRSLDEASVTFGVQAFDGLRMRSFFVCGQSALQDAMIASASATDTGR